MTSLMTTLYAGKTDLNSKDKSECHERFLTSGKLIHFFHLCVAASERNGTAENAIKNRYWTIKTRVTDKLTQFFGDQIRSRSERRN